MFALTFIIIPIVNDVVSLILCKLSLGDARAYYLSTAKNELGVVSAESGAGKYLVLDLVLFRSHIRS